MSKIMKSAILAVGLVAAASSAQAADKFINIYGASAQKTFWGDLGVPYLTTADVAGGAGCATATKAAFVGSSNFGIVKGENCSTNGGGNIYLTYGAVASNEGPKAVKEIAPIDDINSCAAINGNQYRVVVDETTCDWTGTKKCAALKCGDIQLGASDVAGESFVQESHGGKNGWYDTTPFDVVLSPEVTTGLDSYRPTVVPFGFFMNNDADTVTYPAMANLTRMQAANLFGGYVYDWGQFDGGTGTSYPAGMGVVACLRHAGSGTHASLDRAVMRNDISLANTEQIIGAPGALPDIQFFQSSSGEARCVAENGGYGAGSGFIAVGYADADATASTGNGMHSVKFEGAEANAANIANGVYPFWSHQWIYLKPADNDSHIQRMMAYASSHVPPTKQGVWLTADELKVNKASDSSLPVLQ